jgi:eukaryotic-like serine/threonine-protein kinase
MKCPACGIENLDDSRFCRKCATPLPGGAASFTRTILAGPAELASGTMIAGHYRIDKILGRGGMGVVYLADDTRLKRPVALKFLPPGLALDEDIRKRFIIEAQAAAALSHSNICTIYEVDDQAEKAFISMEYVEGENLRDKTAKGPLPFDRVLDIALQVCAGLDEAHKKGIVHRDIKSANIMLTATGQAKIMDFGLAKVAGSAMVTKEGSTMGTAAYMSPEQAKGEAVDAQTDIWSLGVVLYELASGKLPFRGDLESAIVHNIIHEEPKPLKAIVPKVPEEFERIVKRGLKKKVDDRYGSAAEMLTDLKKLQANLEKEKAGVFNIRSFLRLIRKPLVAIPATLVLIGLGFLIYSALHHQAKVRWARDVALPQIEKFISVSEYTAGFMLASQAGKYIAENPKYKELASQVTGPLSFQTDPPRADVFIKDYMTPDAAWLGIGRSPLLKAKVPGGFQRWKASLTGYESAEGAITVESMKIIPNQTFPAEVTVKLDKLGTLPAEMVRIKGGRFSPELGPQGSENLPELEIPDYLLDRYEVTNRKYKRFIEAGGYKKPEYWTQKFVINGHEISWDSAMKLFLDKTGRPGPANWESGDYPEGQDDLPVTGVSWFEAAAYAAFAGKSLPTLYHWNFAIVDTRENGILSAGYVGFVLARSNFSGKGPAAVGTYQGISPRGIYDMAGNAKEWCFNKVPENRRLILGAGWNEEDYQLGNGDSFDAFSREANFGFRCMKLLSEDESSKEAAKPLPPIPAPDLANLKPCSDEVFAIYKKLYDYNKSALNSKVESQEDLTKYTRMERVSFDAAYGDERITAYLFFPRTGSPPFQTVIFYPGGSAFVVSNFFKYASRDSADRLTKNGRAFVCPILYSQFERKLSPEKLRRTTWPERWILSIKDFRRTIDYLETRHDIDLDKLSYNGLSTGAWMGGIIPALEPRLKAAVLMGGGLEKLPPEISQAYFTPRIKIPILMQNGRFDLVFPLETSAKPFFELFGTLEKDKYLRLYNTSHSVWLTNEVIRDELDFLDKYLSPVK